MGRIVFTGIAAGGLAGLATALPIGLATGHWPEALLGAAVGALLGAPLTGLATAALFRATRRE